MIRPQLNPFYWLLALVLITAYGVVGLTRFIIRGGRW